MGLETPLSKEVIKIPQDFTDCVKNGGRVVTKSLKKNKYIHICYDKNGKPHSGEVKTKKEQSSSKKEAEEKQIKDSKVLVESLKELQQYFNTNFHV